MRPLNIRCKLTVLEKLETLLKKIRTIEIQFLKYV